MRQLTSLDANFLAMETRRTYGHVSGMAIYDPSTAPGGQVTVKDLCRLVGERLHLLPPFRWKLVGVPFGLDHPYWIEDPDFDLDFHLRETAVAPPGDDRHLADLVARIVARPLDRAHPLWELYFIHGLAGGRFALLTKIHHAVVDGVSGAEIMGTLLDFSPEGREVPPPDPGATHGERQPSQVEMLGRGLLGLPRQPLRMARALPRTLPNLTEIPLIDAVPGMPTVNRATAPVRKLLGAPVDPHVLEIHDADARAPRTPFNGKISPHRRFAFGSVSLDSIRSLKAAVGISVNDVVVALCATALRNWLLERDALPDEPLVAMVPVSVRTPEQQGTFGNRVSMMIVPIPTNEADPRRRLQRAHEVLATAKQHHKALPAELLQDATQFIPPAIHARAARVIAEVAGVRRVRPPLNVVISNVPGPANPLYCAGSQLQANFPVSVITDGVGLNITCLSYRDHIDFGIVADREQVDDVWPMIDELRDGLDELCDVICGAGAAPPPPRRVNGRVPAGAGV